MAVYSNYEINAALDDGHIVCHPLTPANIRGSSIDLTLGENFYFCGRKNDRPLAAYNPFSRASTAAYFGSPMIARPTTHPLMQLWYPELKHGFEGIDPEHPIIWLLPRTRILAHTHEFIGIHPPGTTEMRARSSWGRNGIVVCMCSGWGDPGYINRWTMEIQNFNDHAVPLPVGERIAQLIFHRTGPVSGAYGEGGKYQVGTDIKQIVKTWSPDQMLPRSYKDERRMPVPLDFPSEPDHLTEGHLL